MAEGISGITPVGPFSYVRWVPPKCAASLRASGRLLARIWGQLETLISC